MASEVPDLLPGDPADFQDPAYREAVVDLLGAISYGEISAFERLAEDSKMAPAIRDKMALATMAAAELGHVARLHERLTELGADPYDAMAPFIAPIEKFHRHTAPADWYEGLVKAYVGDGLAADFYREIAAYLDSATRDLVIASLEDSGEADFVVDRIRQAIAARTRSTTNAAAASSTEAMIRSRVSASRYAAISR